MKKVKPRKFKVRTRKIIKLGIGILSFFLFILHIYSVDANMLDSTIQKNRKEGIYAVTKVNGEDHLYYLNMYTMNGRVSYCIDLGKDIITDIYHSTDDFSISSLSSNQINYIRSISYFGYQYKDHNDYRYYMAAQELIWEYLSGAKVEWTNVLDVNGERINIDNYKRDILVSREYYYRNFIWDKEDGIILKPEDTVVFTDTNNALYSYEILSTDHVHAQLEGRELSVTALKDGAIEGMVTLKHKEYYSYDSSFYYYDNSQRLISNGNFDPREYQLHFLIEKPSLRIQVVDFQSKKNIPSGEASLDGARYQLYRSDGELVEEFSTDSSGQALVPDLEYGDYYIKQISPSGGYQSVDEVVSVGIDNILNTIILEEKVIENDFLISKVYGKDEDQGEDGIWFSIYDSSMKLVQQVSTDDMGMVSFSLPYGRYTVCQDNTSYGYEKVENFSIIVDRVVSEVIPYHLVDSYLEYKVQIVTREKERNEIIRQEGFQYKIKDKSTSNYLEYEGKNVFTTDSSGMIILPMKLGYGTYIIEQVGVPYGYVLNLDCLEFKIDDQSNFFVIDDEEVMVLDFYNQVILGELNVVTVREVFFHSDDGFSYLNEVRDNVEVIIYALDDITFLGKVIYQKGEEVQRGISNEEGKVFFDNLYLGNYCVADKNNGLEQCFSFPMDNYELLKAHYDIILNDTLEKTDIILQNIDSLGKKIEGSKFLLYDVDKELVYTGFTNQEGVIKILDLPLGKYCFKQENVPYGYALYEGETCFELLDGSIIKKVSVVNQKSIGKWVFVPNTLMENRYWLFLFVVISLIIIGGVIYQKITR